MIVMQSVTELVCCPCGVTLGARSIPKCEKLTVHMHDRRTAQQRVQAMLAHMAILLEHAMQHTKTNMTNCSSCSILDAAGEL